MKHKILGKKVDLYKYYLCHIIIKIEKLKLYVFFFKYLNCFFKKRVGFYSCDKNV